MIKIRKFINGDEKEISKVIALDLRNENIRDYPREDIERLITVLNPEFIAKRASWCHGYTICDDDKIIGVGMIGPYWGSETEASLFTIFIDPNYKGRGVGRKIIETLENDEFFKRSERVEIPASISAVEFYRHFGYNFKITDEVKGNIVDDEGEYRLEKFPKEHREFNRAICNLRPYIDNEYHNYKDFIYELKKEAYKEYVVENYGDWDEDFQRELFKKYLDEYGKDVKIIELNGETIGFFQGRLDKDTYEIGNICIKKEYQGQGIGTLILKEIIEKYKDCDFNLQVFKQNRAIKLYKKLGFEVTEAGDTHYKMIRKADKDEKRVH